MVKRGRKRKGGRSRRSGAVNLWNLAQSFIGASIVTNGFFNVSPRQFFLAWPMVGQNISGIAPTGNSGSKVTLYELLNWNQLSTSQVGTRTAFGQVQENLRTNLAPMVMSLIALRFGSTFLKRALRPMLSQTNRMLKAGGLASTVRV